jgi:hypothetical protein
MSQQKQARHNAKLQIAVETTVTYADNKAVVPSQKRKEQAKQTLYLNRI